MRGVFPKKRSNKIVLSLSKFILWLVALFLILSCQTIMYVYLQPTVLTHAATKAVLYALCLLYVLVSKGISKKGFLLSGACGVLGLIYVLFSGRGIANEGGFVRSILVPMVVFPVFCCQVLERHEAKHLIKAFADIMIAIAAISLFFWIFGTVMDVLPFKRVMHYHNESNLMRTETTTYFGVYFETQVTDAMFRLLPFNKRNVGIFLEAPGYAAYLTFALVAELLCFHEVKWKRIGLIILTVLSTFSTKAYLTTMMGLFLYFTLIEKRKSKWFQLLKFVLAAGVLIAAASVGVLLVKDKLASASGVVRLDDLTAGFKALARNPLFGVGMGNSDEIREFFSVKRSFTGISMGITFFAQTGLYLLFFYLGGLFCAFRQFRASRDRVAVKKMQVFTAIILTELFISNECGLQIVIMMVCMGYALKTVGMKSSLKTELIETVQFGPEAVAQTKQGIRFVWKPPIWLEEDDGKATGIREENVSFAVFNTLIRRSVARPADLFRIMEQNGSNVPEHFAEKRMEAERTAYAKFGARMGLADIYEELLPLYGSRTNDLMALEIQYEIAGCRPVPENIDLVNLCMEHDKNVFLIADTYLPSSVLRRMLDVCGVYHYDRLYVSCEEGACKADGSLFWKVLADQEIRPHELRHIGSDRQGDITEPWRVGVHVKRGKKKDQSAVDKDLPEETAWYGRTLQTCIRNCADDLDSDDARLGCETFGPLLAGFVAWLREQLRRDDIQDVYFLAGDGAVLKQAFDALEDGAFRTHSLYFPAQTADQDHEALLAYLLACGMQGRVALVDTGRQVTVQKTLENLIAEAGLNIQVKGYYVGLADADGMQAAGYLYEPGHGAETLEKLSPITVLFDTIFHAQHGAVRRIAMRDGQPVPELNAYEYASDEGRICDEIAILRAYQAGAIELVHEMNTAFPGGVPQIPGEAAILPLLRMGTKPTKQEAELWGDFRVFEDGKAILMARPKGIVAYLLHPGQFKRDYAASPWKIGFLRRLLRFPLAFDKIANNG